MNIADIAIKRPFFVLMLVLAIITIGVIGFTSMPTDLMPNVEYPFVAAISTYPGASASDMENLFTKPLENTLSTVEGLDTMTSTTREGYSMVLLNFKMEVDPQFAELKVREKVQAARKDLPSDAEEPTVQRFSTEDTPVMVLALRGDVDSSVLRDYYDDHVKPLLETTAGVGTITVVGSRQKQINIEIDRSLLLASGISYNQVITAIQRRNISMPVGSVKESTKNVTVRVTGKTENLQDIRDITLSSQGGRIVRIRDLARVSTGLEDEVTRARVYGQAALLFSVYKQSGANIVDISRSVHSTVADLQGKLPKGISIAVVSDNSTLISRSITGVETDILMGILLAILVVWLFLGNFRSTLITAVALPNSILGSFFLLKMAGFSINTVSLLALSLAVGLLIDDSIVVRENIFRHIEKGEHPRTAALKGTNEVFLPVLSTTLSIMAVFLPISFMSGIIGKFFKEFGLTIAFALAISLLDAFTTAPMLSAYWYKDSKTATSALAKLLNRFSAAWERGFARVSAAYGAILEWALRHKKTILSSAVVLLALSSASVMFIGQNFISPVDAGNFTIHLETYPGAPLDIIDKPVAELEKFLAQQAEIENFYVTIGGEASHKAMVNVDLVELKKRHISTQALLEKTRSFLKAHYAASLTFLLEEKSAISSVMGSGSSASRGVGGGLQINIKGAELDVLEKLGQEVSQTLSQTPGATDVSSSYKPGTPELVLKLDPIKAEKVGITALELGGILRDLIHGALVSTISLNGKDYQIVVKLRESDLTSRNDVRDIQITARNGKRFPVSAVCELSWASSPLEISRESKERVVKVTSNIAPGFTLAGLTESSRKNIKAQVNFPDGYTWTYAGQQKYFADMGTQMGLAMALSVLFMFMILTSLYNSPIQPLYIMISLPLAFIGAFLMLLLTGVDLDLYGYIGLIMVLGLVAKNAILLLDFTNKQRVAGMSIREALLHAGPVRLRPILMTSFAIIFGMLPLALGLNEGSTGRQALPMTVIGGILTSTFLTLVVVPVVYEAVEYRLERWRQQKAQQAGQELSS